MNGSPKLSLDLDAAQTVSHKISVLGKQLAWSLVNRNKEWWVLGWRKLYSATKKANTKETGGNFPTFRNGVWALEKTDVSYGKDIEADSRDGVLLLVREIQTENKK